MSKIGYKGRSSIKSVSCVWALPFWRKRVSIAQLPETQQNYSGLSAPVRIVVVPSEHARSVLDVCPLARSCASPAGKKAGRNVSCAMIRIHKMGDAIFDVVGVVSPT